MKTLLTITEITRMYRGNVCIAGIDPGGACIRPVLAHGGIHEQSLLAHGNPIVFPFAVVEYELLRPAPQPPHTEDYLFNPAAVRFVKRLGDQDRLKVLTRSMFPCVADIFEQTIHADFGRYVMDGQGPRSLGTIKPHSISRVGYEPDQGGTWDYRLTFNDGQDSDYRLKIVDLSWHYFCDQQRSEDRAPAQIASDLTALLRERKVYLRIGLSRGWQKFPDRCYLQITGIHTFPDYLNGKTFADLAPYAVAHQ